MAWVARIHPDDVEKLADAVEKHRTSTEPISYEYQVQRRDGSWRSWSDYGVPILDVKGRPRKWVGVCSDITERKSADEKLRMSERGLIETQRIAQLGSWEVDVVTQEITWSAETFRIAGFDEVRDNLTLDEYLATVHPDDLPLLNRVMEQASAERQPSAGETGFAAGQRVLLVEDNEINREVAQEMLVIAGLSVTPAENGVEALRVLEEANFDAVLMDVQMPEMDGIDATRAIRADLRYGVLPIIAMTAHAMEGDRERCLEAGMNDYVTKPIEENELLGVLSKWLPVRSSATPDRTRGDDTGGGLPFEPMAFA